MGKETKSTETRPVSKRPQYEIQSVTLIGYGGERREMDVRKEFSLFERVCNVNPNYDRTQRIKDAWLQRFNELRKKEEELCRILRLGGIRNILWVDINFKCRMV